MKGARSLADSGRGVWCVAIAIVAVVLVVLKYLTGAEWVSFMQWITVTLVVGRTYSDHLDKKNAAAVPAPSAQA